MFEIFLRFSATYFARRKAREFQNHVKIAHKPVFSNFSFPLFVLSKALLRSKFLAALALNFFKTLRSRSRSKRFERRSILRSF